MTSQSNSVVCENCGKTEPQYVYQVTFASNNNDNWHTNVIGLYKTQKSAINAIYDIIIDNASRYLCKEARRELDCCRSSDEEESCEDDPSTMQNSPTPSSKYSVHVCPDTIDGLDEWSWTFSCDDDQWYKYSSSICEDWDMGWGWDIKKVKLED